MNIVYRAKFLQSLKALIVHKEIIPLPGKKKGRY
jgi:hypothetical protein